MKKKNNIKEARIRKGWTQLTLASKLRTSISRVSAWELQKGEPLQRTKYQICELLNESMDYLFPNI